MQTIKKLIIATALLTAFAPAAYAMDQEQSDEAKAKETEEERQARLAQEQVEADCALINACTHGTMQQVHAAFARGANVNAKVNRGAANCHWPSMAINGSTPLHAAAKHGDAELTQMLIDMNAEVDATDACGYTPLYCAVQEICTDKTIQVLINNQANVNAATEYGWTPLQLAAMDQYSDSIVQILLDHDADINATNKWGDTAVSLAAEKDHGESLRTLLLHGAEDQKLQTRIDSNQRSLLTRNAYNDANKEIADTQDLFAKLVDQNDLPELPVLTDIRHIIGHYIMTPGQFKQMQTMALERELAKMPREQEDVSLAPENRQQSLAEAQQELADTREQESIALASALDAQERTQALESALNVAAIQESQVATQTPASESEGKENEEFTEQELRAYEKRLQQRDRDTAAADTEESSADAQSQTNSVSTEQWEHLTMQQKRDKLSKAAARRGV